jgi:hypothetical protein
MEKWGTSDGFELVPGIRIPAGVKKKTFRMDGPTAYSESDFATSLIQKAEKYDV